MGQREVFIKVFHIHIKKKHQTWWGSLHISATQRAMPAGAYAPGMVTHAGQVKV